MTRHLIVGAGASLAECKAAGLPDDLCLPVIKNFARKMWTEYSPARLLDAYLQANEISLQSDQDVRDAFLNLEDRSPDKFNIELFFEFAWTHRREFPGAWASLSQHGILNPLQSILIQGLWKDGVMNAPLTLAPKVAGKLNGGDVVLDLNYDTLFEIGAAQAGKELTFLPNTPSPQSIRIAKPHGSINLVVNTEANSFAFGRLDWTGNPQPADGSTNFAGFIPPRFNKSYQEHPVALAILQSLAGLQPDTTTFWGVGFTKSDIDLAALYSAWCEPAKVVEVINPDMAVADALEAQFGPKVKRFQTIEAWLSHV